MAKAAKRSAPEKTAWNGKTLIFGVTFVIVVVLIAVFATQLASSDMPRQTISDINGGAEVPRENLVNDPGPTPEATVAEYVARTYISSQGVSGDITFSNFQYLPVLKSDTAAEVTLTFTKTTRSGLYTLTQYKEQFFTLEKRGSDWYITKAPPSVTVSETRT